VRVVIDVVSVMAAYFDLLCLCIVHRAEGPSAWCTIHAHIGTRYVILAKHWLWLPDDVFT